MNTKELLQLMKEGLEPVVRFNTRIEETDNGPDNGMLGRIVGVGPIEEDGGDTFVKLHIDVESFRAHNEKCGGQTYFDRDNDYVPVSWFDSGLYPENGKCFELYEMVEIEGEDSEPLFFDLCDQVLINRYLEMSDKYRTYIDFLEDAARKQYHNELTDKIKTVNNQ